MKKILRELLLQKRNLLTQEEIEAKSSLIHKQLMVSPLFQRANRVMLYISFRNEVLTSAIIKELLQKGKRVFIPITVPKTKALIVSELKSLEEDLQLGNFGVLEPKPEAVRELDPSCLDLILVPGVGFDMEGFRIGYGAGYYDRFLPRISKEVPTIGLAFEVQLVHQLPKDEYDYPVQYVLTEERLIDCSNLQTLIFKT